MRLTLAFAAAFLLASPLAAETALFVTSAPLRAEVTIDGTAYGATPVLVRGLDPGEHEVSILKPGFQPASSRVELTADTASAVELRPQPDRFVGSFSADETIVGDEVYSQQDSTFELPSGTYELTADGNSLHLNPVFPRQGALDAAKIVTVAAGVAALLATVEDLFVNDSATSYWSSFLPSPATIAVITIAGAAGGFWIGLDADRRAYERRVVVNRYEDVLTPSQAEAYFLAGEQALEAGSLSLALTNYTRVVAEGGDTEYLPESLYKSAQIYSVSSDLKLAASLLELLIRDYPAPGVYDRANRSLADIYVSLKRYDDAIARLNAIVYLDDQSQRSDVATEIEQIRELAAGGSQ